MITGVNCLYLIQLLLNTKKQLKRRLLEPRGLSHQHIPHAVAVIDDVAAQAPRLILVKWEERLRRRPGEVSRPKLLTSPSSR